MHTRLALALVALLPLATARADAPSAEGVAFFETKVRPVLAAHCYSCHGPDKQKAGLRLDTRQAALRGTDVGPVILPAKPDESPLVRAVRYTGDYDMPPKGKLPDAAVADLERWVAMGAPWPADRAGPAEDKSKSHWAFQPVREPAIPRVTGDMRTPVDAFILQKLADKKLTPSPEADRRTLIRRVTFDLTGLPPTAAEVAAFEQDKAPDAYEKLVERLLASPHYGERWARLWMDVARYSDTKGYVFQEDRNYPYAYTYRDYLIRSFNDDKPYDRFLTEQVAADRLDLGDDKRPLAALGFLTLGRRFIQNTHDIIDDRIDVVTRGTMGLTVSCARCHDHKYDPVPTRDYYSLYGVFASTVEPEPPLIEAPQESAAAKAFAAELAKLEAERNAMLDKAFGAAMAKLKTPASVSAYLLAASELGSPDQRDLVARLRERDLNPRVFRKWRQYLDARRADDPVWSAYLALTKLPASEWAKAPAIAAARLGGAPEPLKRAFAGVALPDRKAVAERYAQAVVALPSLVQGDGPLNFDADKTAVLERRERDRIAALQRKVDAFKAKSPAAPPRAMAVADAPQPTTPVVFVRGNPGNRGPEVPRQFPAIAAPKGRVPFAQGSGRLEMARLIASPDNPLTARVFVNRVWAAHFGAGLVTTPSDFGVRSDPPSHPELLDWLAARFVAEGWSVKKLHRFMVLSATYRRSSAPRPDLAAADPENRLLGRMSRRRLDLEMLRDALLAAGGTLDPAVFGRSEQLFDGPGSRRRTLYGFIDRQNLPGVYRAFDYASPDMHAPQRFQTTVPQQALFLMNNGLALEQARGLLARPAVSGHGEPAAKLSALYAELFGRRPDPDEQRAALAFVAAPLPAEPQGAGAWVYGTGRVNEASKRLEGFTPLPHFGEGHYAGGPKVPDPKLGWAMLTASGGHPGNPLAVVRRWVAPDAGVYRVDGVVRHLSPAGDGVRARVITARHGVVGERVVHNRSEDFAVPRIELKVGESIDCVVDCRADENSDSFQWSPRVRRLEPATPGLSSDSAAEFGPPRPATPPPSAWELLAQALLMSNEFAFVD